MDCTLVEKQLLMVIRTFCLLSLILSFTACTRGWIYTNVTSPFCTDMGGVPTNGKSSSAGLKQISIPRIPGSRTLWSSNSIADAVKGSGIETIQYCDRTLFSVLGGLWSRDFVTVYGE